MTVTRSETVIEHFLSLHVPMEIPLLPSPPCMPKTKLADVEVKADADDNSTDADEHSNHMAMMKQMKLVDQLGWSVEYCPTSMFDNILSRVGCVVVSDVLSLFDNRRCRLFDGLAGSFR